MTGAADVTRDDELHGAAGLLQQRDGLLVRDGGVEHVRVYRQNLVILLQAAISATTATQPCDVIGTTIHSRQLLSEQLQATMKVQLYTSLRE